MAPSRAILCAPPGLLLLTLTLTLTFTLSLLVTLLGIQSSRNTWGCAAAPYGDVAPAGLGASRDPQVPHSSWVKIENNLGKTHLVSFYPWFSFINGRRDSHLRLQKMWKIRQTLGIHSPRSDAKQFCVCPPLSFHELFPRSSKWVMSHLWTPSRYTKSV